MTRFVDDGIELDNNIVECSIRLITLNRKMRCSRTELRCGALAWLRRAASRWRRLRSRMRRTGAIEGIGGRVAAGAGSSAARTSGSSLAC
ncbi:hypothetical protein [Bradyrhizobium barranii]|uniref:hypothetical protein n=1 Tax=Bradyrhizobium barranii TaxID=2992140 RepID=UPI003CCACA25